MMVYACLPTLFYIFVMAEDKSYTDNKTKYLKELEMLKKEYESCYGDCIGDRNLHKLSLLMAMFQGYEKFKKIAQDLKTRLIMDIDKDVDYMEWSNLAHWTKETSNSVQYSSPLTYESLGIEKLNFPDKLADLMAPSQEDAIYMESQNVLVGRVYKERTKFKETIGILINNSVFNDKDLDIAIGNALEKLRKVLSEIPKAIKEKHDNQMYESLYKGQNMVYSKEIGKAALQSYQDWKSEYLDGDEITEDSFRKHAEETLIRLLESGVMDIIKVNLTKEKEAQYKKEILFRKQKASERPRYYELYARFREIYELKNNKYCVKKEKAGDLIFRMRKDKQKLNSYFTLDFTLMYINNDIDQLRNKNLPCSKIHEIDFKNLECRFSEEQVKESGIKHHHADGLLAIMDIMKENVSSINWFGFYCVLLEKKYIEDNMSKFCKNMNALFDVKLNKSNLNKEKNKKDVGINIENWTEENIRIKIRKAFALKFKEVVEGYENYLLSQATQA